MSKKSLRQIIFMDDANPLFFVSKEKCMLGGVVMHTLVYLVIFKAILELQSLHHVLHNGWTSCWSHGQSPER